MKNTAVDQQSQGNMTNCGSSRMYTPKVPCGFCDFKEIWKITTWMIQWVVRNGYKMLEASSASSTGDWLAHL